MATVETQVQEVEAGSSSFKNNLREYGLLLSLVVIIVVGAARSYGCCLLSTSNSGYLQSGGSPNEVGNRFVAPQDCSTIDSIGALVAGSRYRGEVLLIAGGGHIGDD